MYSNYQLWLPQLHFLLFDSRLNESPKSDIVIAGKGWAHAGREAHLVGCETIDDNCLYVKSAKLLQDLAPVSSNEEIGSEVVLGVDTDGLYPEEGEGTFHYRWTNGNAVLRFSPTEGTLPKQLTVSLIIPSRVHFRLQANDAILFDGPLDAGKWEKSCALPRSESGTPLRISLQSDTFVPKPVYGYTRTLGVQLVSLKVQ